MPHDLPGDHVDDPKAALEQFEREKHLMPCKPVIETMAQIEPTIRDALKIPRTEKSATLLATGRLVDGETELQLTYVEDVDGRPVLVMLRNVGSGPRERRVFRLEEITGR